MTIRDRFDAFAAQFRSSAPKETVEKPPLPPGAAPLLWCVLLTGVGIAALVGSTWMLLVFVAGSVGHVDWHSDYSATNDGPASFVWSVKASIHWLVGVGLFLFCAAIAMFNATWLEARRHIAPGLTRNVMTGIGVAVALFMVSGAIVVQQKGTDARAQDSAKEIGAARAGVAAIDAEIAAIETEMARLCAPNLTTWQAQACRSGESAWADRTAISRSQKGLPRETMMLIERAMADAKAGDRWRGQLTELRKQRAVAAVTTVETEVQTVKAEGWMAAFTAFLEDVRKPVTATLGELLAMIAFGLAMSAWATRREHGDVVAGAVNGVWASDAQMIPDLREEEAPRAKPMTPNQQKVYDAETGEELEKITPREYFRRKPKKKGDAVAVPVDPIVLPDETGVVLDGDSRAARSGVEEGDDQSAEDRTDSAIASQGEVDAGADGFSPAASVGIDHADESGRDGDRADAVGSDTDTFLDSLIGPDLPAEELADDFIGPPAPVEKRLGADGTGGVVTIAAE